MQLALHHGIEVMVEAASSGTDSVRSCRSVGWIRRHGSSAYSTHTARTDNDNRAFARIGQQVDFGKEITPFVFGQQGKSPVACPFTARSYIFAAPDLKTFKPPPFPYLHSPVPCTSVFPFPLTGYPSTQGAPVFA